MTKDELNAAIQAIGTCEDEAQRRDLLAQLSENAGADYDQLAEITGERDRLAEDNEALRNANMKLFLRVGNPSKEPPKEPENKDLKFEDLFNEKGELK